MWGFLAKGRGLKNNYKPSMEKETSVGISQIGIELPAYYVDVEKVARLRNMDPKKATDGLMVKRARIPFKESLWQLAAGAIRKIDYRDVKTFFFATESNPDASKPVIALKTLKTLGLSNVVCIPTTFACFGGVQSLLAASKIAASQGEPVIVVTADRAIYRETEPEAEVTQGCAALAIRIEPNPRLLRLDYQRAGIYLDDIDDFTVPWDWYPVPKLDPKLIKPTYLYCVKSALLDWERKNKGLIEGLKKEGKTILDKGDFFIFHCPFLKFTEWAFAALYSHYKLEKIEPSLKEVMENPEIYPQYKKKLYRVRSIPEFRETYQKKVLSVLGKYNPEVGNAYDGSVFVGLIAALEKAKEGDEIGISGFGSGAGSLAMRGTVLKTGFQSDLREQLDRGRELTIEEYQRWREREIKK